MAPALKHHHLIQGAQLLKEALPIAQVQHPRQQHGRGVERQPNRVGLQLFGFKGGNFNAFSHTGPDHPLYLGPGHIQQVALGDEAHFDEVLADGHGRIEVGHGVVELGLGDLPPFDQQVGQTI